MSGFYYQVRLKNLQLNQSQLNKIRDHIRNSVRDVAAVDSGEFLRSLETSWNSGTEVLTVGSRLNYSGYIEGGTVNYITHKHKILNVLVGMGLNVSPRRYY